MIRFDCDYTQSAHQKILDRLSVSSTEQHAGYGKDGCCQRAAELVREACAAPDAAVHFMVGGTQANTTILSAMLRPHEGVITAETGHIATHETGAIEATGHKVLTLVGEAGKLSARQVEEALAAHRDDLTQEHTVKPGAVYVSHPTECGTLYTRAELTAIAAVCQEWGIPFMLDGARLGYALAAESADVSLRDLAQLCDVFYIGGTKLGALFGEAVVIVNRELAKDFRYFIKRHGGLLAKGFLLGMQFECLFEDDLYMQLGRHGVEEAMHLRAGLAERGIRFAEETVCNQLFPIVSNELVDQLAADFAFARWGRVDEKQQVIRLCTSWATKREDVVHLLAAIDAFAHA